MNDTELISVCAMIIGFVRRQRRNRTSRCLRSVYDHVLRAQGPRRGQGADRKTSERTELAPSDTANTTMISQICSRRSRSDSGCAETQTGTAETDSSWTERMLTGSFQLRRRLAGVL